MRPRAALAAGAVIATVAAMGTLAVGGFAQAALAPGTPLKALATAQGNRYFGSAMTQNLLSNSTVTQLHTAMRTPGTPACRLNHHGGLQRFFFERW